MVINRFLTVAVLAILATGIASADMLVTTDAVAVGPNTTDFDFSLVFPSTATPAGFHLVGATLAITDTITDSTLTLTNNASSTQHFKFTATSEADITSNSVDSTFVGAATAPTLVLSTGLVSFTSGQSVTYSPITITESLGPLAVSNAAGYLGGATIGGSTLSGTQFLGGGGNIKVDQSQEATVTGELIFDFAPNAKTPEPTSIFLFGTVLLSLGFLRKRRAN